jgi:D-alanine-D-alanine ligase
LNGEGEGLWVYTHPARRESDDIDIFTKNDQKTKLFKNVKIPDITILFNEPVPGSGADDWDVIDEVSAVEKALEELGIPSAKKGIDSGFMQQIELLDLAGVRHVFNLVEAICNKGELNYFIPALLNQKGIAYSGNPLEALFLTTNKRLTGTFLRKNGIRVPRAFLPSEWKKLSAGKEYIIKPVREDGSAGIHPDSVFTFTGQFPEALKNANDHAWLVEEYIDGREFNISLLAGSAKPEILPPAEIIFRKYDPGRPRIVDYNAKWQPGSFEYENTLRHFPDFTFEKQLSGNLERTVFDTWNCLGLKGYARVDLRVDHSGQVFVLEANANPCISPDSGFVAAAEQAGYSFKEVVERILNDMNNP